MAETRLADVVVPEVFNPYVTVLTAEKSRVIQSGALVHDARLDASLAGGGLTFNNPFWKDLANENEDIGSDNPDEKSTPSKITTGNEIQVRMSRNKSWSSMDLVADLIARDPMAAIANRVSSYWAHRLQAAYVATMKGVFADNSAAPSGTEHVQNDLTFDVSSTAFKAGVTSFSAAAFVDATSTMGDSMNELGMIMVHSVVYNRMLKNNMIEFIPVSINNQAVTIQTFLGREVIVDDGMPNQGGVFDSWLFAKGAVRLGMGTAHVPTEIDRVPAAGNGSGQEIMYTRRQLCIHPIGHAYVGTPANGGPSNEATTNNLAHADSWRRVFPERKQIKIARLVTREF
mgnify:CR=1 FL=1